MTIRVRSASVGCRTSGPATVKSATLGESYQVRLGGAGGARTHDRRIMRTTAPCTMRASCTDDTETALMALTALGLSGASVHEPVHDPLQRPLRSVTMHRASSAIRSG